MSDLISRDGVLKEIRQQKSYAGTMSQQVYSTGFIVSLSILEGVISEIPAVDAAPVRHGRWIKKKRKTYPDGYVCSECDDYIYETWADYTDFNFCPNCGAKMDLEAKHE